MGGEKNKSGRGRPSKLREIDFKEVERLAGLGSTDEEMAMFLGVTARTFNNWKKNPDFFQALKRGKAKVDLVVVDKLLKKALDGDTTAIIFWLKNRQRERWRDKRDIGLGGDGEGIVDVRIEVVKTKG